MKSSKFLSKIFKDTGINQSVLIFRIPLIHLGNLRINVGCLQKNVPKDETLTESQEYCRVFVKSVWDHIDQGGVLFILKHILVARSTNRSLLINENVKNNLRLKITFETRIDWKWKCHFEEQSIFSKWWSK